MANVNDIMKELAEYIRMGEQIAATVDGRFVGEILDPLPVVREGRRLRLA